jgi:hypothetical protein
MNGSAPLAVTRFIIFIKRAIASGAFAFYIYKTRNASPSHLRGVWMKPVARFVHSTDSGALPFVYLKFYDSHSYF